MTKNLFFIAAMLLSILSYAQDIKVKKGEIQVNGKSVAKIEKKNKEYAISDLSGNELFTAIITNETPLDNYATKTWLQLKANNGIVREVSIEERGSFTLSNERNVSQILLLNASSLFPNQVSEAAVNDFLQTEDRSISTAEDLVIEEFKRINNIEDSIASTNKLVINPNGFIHANNQKIGYILRKSKSDGATGSSISYHILDMNKIEVASVNFSSSATHNAYYGFKVITYDGKSAEINRASYTSEKIDTDDLAKRTVRKLYANGYTLGDMKSLMQITMAEKNEALQQEWQEKNDLAKLNSKNIYEVPGYVIESNGTKKEGLITVEFEAITTQIDKNMADLTKYGSSVMLKIDEKNTFFKAKDGIKFCAGERCFLGTSGSEDGGTGNSSGSQLGVFGESLFFEIQAEHNENYVLNYVKNPDYYYLKIKNQPKKAVYLGDRATFGTKKVDKIKKIFDEYLSCSAMSFEAYDTKTKEGLVQVINDYSTKCTK